MKRAQILKFVLPLAIVAAAGVALFQLGALDRLTGSDEEASATPAATVAAGVATGSTETTAEPQSEPATTDGPGEQPAEPKGPSGLEKVESALAKHDVVVVVVYTPDAAVDALQVAEARQGAEEVEAGFVALAATKEHQIAEFAEAYSIRNTPSVLVLVAGPEVVKRFSDYVDHVTVAQAVQNIRLAQS